MDYKKIYDDLCASRKYRDLTKEVGYEVHHILPRSIGGGDEESNLVKLTYKEHYLAHKLLFKFTEGTCKRKMYQAVVFMSGINRYSNGRSYEIMRRGVFEVKNPLPVGVYLVNPSALPFNSLEELLGRLVNFNYLFFTIPRSRKFYRNGEFNTINKYLNNLLDEGVIEKYGKWGTYDLYQIIKDDFVTTKENYTRTDLLYTNNLFCHEKDHKYLCWFDDIGFKNPPTNNKSPLNTKTLEHFEGKRKSQCQEQYQYLCDGNLKNENRDSIVKEYREFRGMVNSSKERPLDFLVDVYNSLLSYDAVGIPYAKEKDLGFDKKVRNKIIKFLCTRFNAKYYKSVKIKGGTMSIPTIVISK